MLLCHKCSGVLSKSEHEDTSGLHGCECISGWVRGFEPNLTREEAIAEQIKACDQWIELFQHQGRSQDWIDEQEQRKQQLLAL